MSSASTPVLSFFIIFLICCYAKASNFQSQVLSIFSLNALFCFKVVKYIHPTWNWNFSILLGKYFTFLCFMYQSGTWALILKNVIKLNLVIEIPFISWWRFPLLLIFLYRLGILLVDEIISNFDHFRFKCSCKKYIENIFLLSTSCWTTS